MGRPLKGTGPRLKRDYKTTDADHARLKGEADRRTAVAREADANAPKTSVNDVMSELIATLPEAP